MNKFVNSICDWKLMAVSEEEIYKGKKKKGQQKKELEDILFPTNLVNFKICEILAEIEETVIIIIIIIKK